MTIERQLEDALRVLLDGRTSGGSVSINEAARVVGGPRWRSLTVPARRVAHRMVEQGDVELANIVDITSPEQSKKPVRLRRA